MTDSQVSQHILDKQKMQCIKKIVANHYKFDMNVYESKDRHRKEVILKQVVAYFCRKHTKLSLEDIGKSTGGYDHTTIGYGVKTIKNLMSTNEVFKQEINKLDNVIFLSIGSYIKSNYYTIDLNDISSVKISDSKAIIFTGFNTAEIQGILSKNGIDGEIKHHNNTGLYLVD